MNDQLALAKNTNLVGGDLASGTMPLPAVIHAAREKAGWRFMNASRHEKKGLLMASTRSELEQRVADLEMEMSKLKRKVDQLDGDELWWEKITGAFENDPVYDEAMKHGREYRQSQKPKVTTRNKK